MRHNKHTWILLTTLLTGMAGFIVPGCGRPTGTMPAMLHESVFIEMKGKRTVDAVTTHFDRKIFITENGKQRIAETIVHNTTSLSSYQLSETHYLTELYRNDTLQLFDSSDSTLCLILSEGLNNLSPDELAKTDFWLLKEWFANQYLIKNDQQHGQTDSTEVWLNGLRYRTIGGLLLSVDSDQGFYKETAVRVVTDTVLSSQRFRQPTCFRHLKATGSNPSCETTFYK